MATSHPNFKSGFVSDVSSVLIDFDGTICHHDVTDVLLQKFAPGTWEALEQEWLAGRIGARECMSRQIAMMRADPADMKACLDDMAIDADFAAFIEMLRASGVHAAIVSDGLDYSIHHILKRHGLMDIEVFSNHLVYNGDKTWQLKFPYKNLACPAGHCKCRRYDSLPHSGYTVYIGDGASDFCPAGKADLVLAKGRLAEYCRQKQIDHINISSFADVMALWPELQLSRKVHKQVAS